MSFTFQCDKILTVPMNFDGKYKSNKMITSVDHYHHEMLNALEGGDFRWDNACPNREQALVGWLFGFVFTAAGEDYVELRKIIEVMTTHDRRPYGTLITLITRIETRSDCLTP